MVKQPNTITKRKLAYMELSKEELVEKLLLKEMVLENTKQELTLKTRDLKNKVSIMGDLRRDLRTFNTKFKNMIDTI